jgi:Domain of unknown function (DUF1707)/Cell wall-active antibiotics response 4TMS YvqF
MASEDSGDAAPAVRASDAERERTTELLRDAAAEGRLTFEELADRIDVAARAATRAELARLTADLPSPVTATETVAPIRRFAVFGNVRRSGAWMVPARSSWMSVFGDIDLDLREAQVTATEVTIDAGTLFGDVELLVPEGVVVEIRCRTLFGDVRQEAGGVWAAGAPRVILAGGTVFGDVRVRARRLRERLVDRLLGRHG